MKQKLYDAERDTDGYENTVMKHMLSMTAEGLHSKAAIAVELAYRDALIEQLQFELDNERDRSDEVSRAKNTAESKVENFARMNNLLYATIDKVEKRLNDRIEVLEKALRKCVFVLSGEELSKAALVQALQLAVDALNKQSGEKVDG